MQVNWACMIKVNEIIGGSSDRYFTINICDILIVWAEAHSTSAWAFFQLNISSSLWWKSDIGIFFQMNLRVLLNIIKITKVNESPKSILQSWLWNIKTYSEYFLIFGLWCLISNKNTISTLLFSEIYNLVVDC